MTALLELKGVSKHFGGLQALGNVSFDVRVGEILRLIGPNGAGKTTLFNLINGVFAPSSGRIVFNGVDLTGAKPHQIARSGLARTHQLVQPLANMSVLDNCTVGACFGHENLPLEPAPALGATAISAAVGRAGIRPDEVETIVMGNVVQAGTKMNSARQAAVRAGLPVTTPALTVNRVCGSGAQAIVSAAQEIALGNIDVAVAGGMENMDLAPYLVPRARWGHRMGDGQLYDSVLRDGLNDAFSDAHSGWHTEDLVEKYQVTRDAQDRWALRSQQLFASAQAAGHFTAQIVPVEVPGQERADAVRQGRAQPARHDA